MAELTDRVQERLDQIAGLPGEAAAGEYEKLATELAAALDEPAQPEMPQAAAEPER